MNVSNRKVTLSAGVVDIGLRVEMSGDSLRATLTSVDGVRIKRTTTDIPVNGAFLTAVGALRRGDWVEGDVTRLALVRDYSEGSVEFSDPKRWVEGEIYDLMAGARWVGAILVGARATSPFEDRSIPWASGHGPERRTYVYPAPSRY